MTDVNLEMVEHPAHYNTDSGIECIKVTRYLPANLFSAAKYVWRFRDKFKPLEDLEKASFYLDDFEKFLFKSKVSDEVLHVQTVAASKFMMNTKVRDMFRTHILHLQNKSHPEYEFFDALYKFIQKAQHGVVSYELFSEIPLALTDLRARIAAEAVVTPLKDLTSEDAAVRSM